MASGLEAAREAARLRREAGETFERLNPIEKAARNPRSLRLAINGKCFDCMGGDGDSGVRKRISTCSIAKCTLHPGSPVPDQRGRRSS